MKRKIFLILFFSLCGCSFYKPSVRFLYMGQHGPVYEADCDGRRHTMGECYQLANQTCVSGFDILHKSEKTFQTSSYDSEDDFYDSYTSIDRTLLFYCKN